MTLRRWSVPNTQGLDKEAYFNYCHEQTVNWQVDVSHEFYINPKQAYVDLEGEMPDFTELEIPVPEEL